MQQKWRKIQIYYVEIIKKIDFENDSECKKLLFRINNSWLMVETFKSIFDALLDYNSKFGNSLNKMKLLLDVAGVSYKTSYIFESNGKLADLLCDQILVR